MAGAGGRHPVRRLPPPARSHRVVPRGRPRSLLGRSADHPRRHGRLAGWRRHVGGRRGRGAVDDRPGTEPDAHRQEPRRRQGPGGRLSLAGWIVVGLILASLATVAVLYLRDRRGAAESAWKERAGANDGRADAAEAVAEAVRATALERQRELEKRIRDEATERLAHPDRDARRRVQERWQRTDAAGRADAQAAEGDALPDTTSGGPGAGSAGNPKLRGRR